VTGRVEDLILNPEETGKISQVIAEGEYYGMQTFDQALLGHVEAGRVSEKVAMDYASSPHDFKLMLASSGQRASDISQLGGGPGPEPVPVQPEAEPAPLFPAQPGEVPGPPQPQRQQAASAPPPR
jgi:twitching motility protein PilT